MLIIFIHETLLSAVEFNVLVFIYCYSCIFLITSSNDTILSFFCMSGAKFFIIPDFGDKVLAGRVALRLRFLCVYWFCFYNKFTSQKRALIDFETSVNSEQNIYDQVVLCVWRKIDRRDKRSRGLWIILLYGWMNFRRVIIGISTETSCWFRFYKGGVWERKKERTSANILVLTFTAARSLGCQCAGCCGAVLELRAVCECEDAL